mgnify:CR=1 FL=1
MFSWLLGLPVSGPDSSTVSGALVSRNFAVRINVLPGVDGRLMSMSTVEVALAAQEVQSLLGNGRCPSEDLWRFGVLQLLDDYSSVLAFEGVDSAGRVFAEEPARTGHSGIDAAFAALACWLADRDGWIAPDWSLDSTRVARPWWFVSESAYGRAWALVQSPGQFRVRGVFITDTALQRV